MAERVAHRLLHDAKGAELDLGGKASLGAGDLELGDEPGLVLNLGKEARECSDEAKLVVTDPALGGARSNPKSASIVVGWA